MTRLALLLVLVPAVAAHAQRVGPVAVGDRVRITSPALPAPLYGQVSGGVGLDTITVATAGDEARVTLPIAATHRIDVGLGHRRARAAAIGAGIGATAGGLAGAVAASRFGPDAGLALVELALGGATTGAIFGAALGLAYAPEQWSIVRDAEATSAPATVVLRTGARARRSPAGGIEVRGQPDRRRGIVRGAAVLGGIALVFGGIDAARGEMAGGEYVGVIIGNTLIGGAIGYLVSPRGWQRLPGPTP